MDTKIVNGNIFVKHVMLFKPSIFGFRYIVRNFIINERGGTGETTKRQ